MREKDRRFLVEGVQAVERALASGRVEEVFHGEADPRVASLLSTAREAGVPTRAVSPEVMSVLTSTVTPQGLVAVARFVDVPLSEVPADGCVAVLVDVRDPANAGSIVRSAEAAGAAGVVLARSSVDLYNHKAVRASAGSLFHLPVVRGAEAAGSMDALRAGGRSIVALVPDGEESLEGTDLSGPVALVIGNEVSGLTGEIVAAVDRTIRIPVVRPGSSLSLAAAATLVLFEAARQRAGGRGSLPEVIAGAAHDIRSPLTALRGFASTLLSRWERLTDAQRREMLEAVVHDAARMDVVLSLLVDAARLASGAPGLSVAPTDLLEAARSAAADIRQWGTASVEASGEPARAMADPARLRTMLLSLIEAAQWWGEEGPVLVEITERPVPTVRVSRAVTQLDPGAPEALFQPRPPGTSAGSKVGLFVARRLAEALGGRLEVRSGEGILFTLTLSPVGEGASGAESPPHG